MQINGLICLKAGAKYVVPVAEHHDGIPDVQYIAFKMECLQYGTEKEM